MRIRRDRGNTLFVVLFFIVVLSAFAGAAFNFTSGTALAGLRSTQMTLGYGVADAAIETVYSRWRAIVQTQTAKNLGQVLGLFRIRHEAAKEDGGLTDGLMKLIITLRNEARQTKNFALADAIRKGLTEVGVTLEDRPEGTGWRKD